MMATELQEPPPEGEDDLTQRQQRATEAVRLADTANREALGAIVGFWRAAIEARRELIEHGQPTPEQMEPR